MTTINIYLTFNGNCLEAFEFYRQAFGGDFQYVGRYKDMPSAGGGIEYSKEEEEKIMNISLPVSTETILQGSDIGGEWASSYIQGNNFSISINAESREKADDLFSRLTGGGRINMPMQNTFWGSYFGTFTDKFGINWMISYAVKETE